MTEETHRHHRSSHHHHHHHHHRYNSEANALDFGEDWRPDPTGGTEAPDVAAIMSDVSDAVRKEGILAGADSVVSAAADSDEIKLTDVKVVAPPTPIRKRKKKRRKGKRGFFTKLLIGFLVAVLSILLIVTGAFFAMRELGRRRLASEPVAEKVEMPQELDVASGDDGVVYYKGGTYHYKADLINILLMGTDREGELADLHAAEGMSSGQADTLFLLSLNKRTGESHLLNISRDSMVDVDEYNVSGEYTGTSRMQICLAYAYGDGGDLSSRNVEKSVSRLLYGVPINAYAAIDLDAIEPMNEAVEGVQVEVLEDLSNRDPALVQGAVVTLRGSQAETYVRSRNGYDPDPNVARESNSMRMARQRQYVQGYVRKAVDLMKADIRFPVRLYETLQPYMVTDVHVSEVTYLASVFLKGLVAGNAPGSLLDLDMRTLPGESVDGGQYTEYIVDAEEAYPLILELFYDKV